MNPQNPGHKDPPDPFDEPMFLIEELDDMFESHRPFGRSEVGFLAGRNFRPAANVHETEDGLVITMDVPGLEQDDVDIKIEGRTLFIFGKRDFVRNKPDEEFVRLERGFGSFRRAFEVPADVDQDNVAAKLDQGVLTIVVPLKRGQRRIPVNSED
jgi:HSP20 family protein